MRTISSAGLELVRTLRGFHSIGLDRHASGSSRLSAVRSRLLRFNFVIMHTSHARGCLRMRDLGSPVRINGCHAGLRCRVVYRRWCRRYERREQSAAGHVHHGLSRICCRECVVGIHILMHCEHCRSLILEVRWWSRPCRPHKYSVLALQVVLYWIYCCNLVQGSSCLSFAGHRSSQCRS
jgi:hypothetical protein